MNKSLCLIIVASIVMMACSRPNNSVDFVLNRVDSLMFSRPDSALMLLNMLSADSKKFDAENRARYALLMTQARARNYVKATDDSLINIAIEYYSSVGDKERLSWSHVYASDIYRDLCNDSLSLLHIMTANTVAKDVDSDRLHMYIQYFWGSQIRYRPPYTDGINHLCEAKVHAEACRDTAKIIICSNEMAMSYLYLRRFGEARKELSSVGPLISDKQFRRYASSNYSNMALSFYSEDSLKQALVYVDKAIDNISYIANNSMDSLYLFSLKGGILSKLEEYDSARYYIQKGYSESSFNSIARYNFNMSRIEEGSGDYKNALKYHKLYSAALDSLYKQDLKDKALEYENKYRILEVSSERDMLKNKNRSMWLIIGGLTVVIGLLALWFKYKSEQKMREFDKLSHAKDCMNAEAIEQIQSRANELLKRRHINEDYLKKRIYEVDNALKKVRYLKDINKNMPPNSIKTMALTDEEMDSMKLSVDACHNGFIRRLAEEFPVLGEDDLTLCCLIKLGLRSYQIAILMNVTDNTLKRRKQRLKTEKLGLQYCDITLDEWILNKDYPEEEDN